MKGSPRIIKGVVVEIWFFTDNVTDISPVIALPGLQSLACRGSDIGKGKLSDLSPLQGKSLTLQSLYCAKNQISDLSPLRGLSLTFLECDYAQVSDLSPLKGNPLKTLYCASTRVSDLSSLIGMELTNFGCHNTPVSDLSPLKGMPLKIIYLPGSQVSDLSPLEDSKSLKEVLATKTKVTPASVAALQKALPNCKIEWDGLAAPTAQVGQTIDLLSLTDPETDRMSAGTYSNANRWEKHGSALVYLPDDKGGKNGFLRWQFVLAVMKSLSLTRLPTRAAVCTSICR